MSLEKLAYIVSIAKHQSISMAAESLSVSQSTLSKFIQDLESELGQPLFQQCGKKLLLTYAGERYVEKSRMILTLKKELDQELSDIVNDDVGVLRVAFPIMRGTYMLPCTLPVFTQRFPNVRVSVHEANSAVLEDMLLAGEIDLAFFTLPIRNPDISYEVICHEEVVLLMAGDHPKAGVGVCKPDCKYPWVDIAKLSSEKFILHMPDQRTRQIADRIFREAGIEPNVVLSVRNILASVQLAADGYGMSFVGETHLRHIDTKKSPACFSIGRPNITTSFVAAFRRNAYLPRHTQEFIKIVKEFT